MADTLVFDWYERPRWPMPDTQPTLRLGKWNVGFVGYDFTSAAPRGMRYVAYVSLPGLKGEQGHFQNERRAKEAVEKAVRYWVYHLVDRGNVETAPTRRITRKRTEVEPVRVRRVRTPAPVGRVRRTR